MGWSKHRWVVFPLTLLLVVCLPHKVWAAENNVILPMVLTSITEQNPCYEESDLGDLTADAVRNVAGTDLALVPGGLLTNDLPTGQLTQSTLKAVYAQDETLAIVHLTVADLFELLEEALSHLVTDYEQEVMDYEASAFEGYPQISGFSLCIDGSARAGERVYSLTLSDGTKLSPEDANTVLTLACTQSVMDGSYGYGTQLSGQILSMTLSDALFTYLSENEITALDTERVSIIGTNDAPLIGFLPTELLVAILALVMGVLVLFHLKFGKAKRSFLPQVENEKSIYLQQEQKSERSRSGFHLL